MQNKKNLSDLESSFSEIIKAQMDFQTDLLLQRVVVGRKVSCGFYCKLTCPLAVVNSCQSFRQELDHNQKAMSD